MKKHLLLITLVFALLALPLSTMAVTYQIHDLGVGAASGINDSGWVVGTANDSAFVWKNDEMQQLPYLQGYSHMSGATGINNAGQIVGYSSAVMTSGIYSKPVIWNGNDVQSIDLPSGAVSGSAVAVSDNGRVLCKWNGSTSNISGGFTWLNGTRQNTTLEVVNDLNNQYVVGWGYDGTAGRVALAQEIGRSTILLSSPAYVNIAYAVNNIGYQIVGVSNSRAVRWYWFGSPAMVMQDLGTLGGSQSEARDVNNKNQIVGWSQTLASSPYSTCAFLWENGSMQNLGVLEGCVSSYAYAINNNGWIVGKSVDSNGVSHAVLWTPVPEPSSLMTLICGVTAMGGVAWRRRRKN